MRPKLSYSNVMATIAVFIALGGASYAAMKLPKNSVGSKQIKKNAVSSAKIKNGAVTAAKVRSGALTGAQINASTLGTVPSAVHAQDAQTARSAQTANTLGASEGWHEVGTPGDPPFENNWRNGSPGTNQSTESAAFYKDQLGIVHLKGMVLGGAQGTTAFHLPPGYRPADRKVLIFAVTVTPETTAFGDLSISGFVPEEPDRTGAVLPPGTFGSPVSLDGVTFRAEG
jgi:hypothetical protein